MEKEAYFVATRELSPKGLKSEVREKIPTGLFSNYGSTLF